MEKKFDSKIIIISLLLVVIAGLGGFFIGKKNGEVVQKNEVSANQPALEGTNTAGFDDVEILAQMIDDLEYLENYVDEISEDKPLNDMLILDFAFRKAMLEFDSDDITLDNVNKISNKFFGVNVKPDDIPCPVEGIHYGSEGAVVHDEPWYLYDDVNKVWIFNDVHSHGGGATGEIFNKVVNAYYRDGVYKIGVIKAFGNFSEFATTSLHATLADAETKRNVIIDASDGMGAIDSMTAYLHGLFDTYAGDGFHTFEYTFEKTETGFVLKSFKMVD